MVRSAKPLILCIPCQDLIEKRSLTYVLRSSFFHKGAMSLFVYPKCLSDGLAQDIALILQIYNYMCCSMSYPLRILRIATR